MSLDTKRLAIGFLLSFAPPALAADAPASVDSGRSLAIEACSGCHQVTSTQKRPAPVAEGDEGSHIEAPTFATIAARCENAGQLRTEIVNPHYPMREQLFEEMGLDDLAAYIRSLRPVSACPVP